MLSFSTGSGQDFGATETLRNGSWSLLELRRPESDAKHTQLFSKERVELCLYWTTQVDSGLQCLSVAFYLPASGHVYGLVT